jgi:hypothetical protein
MNEEEQAKASIPTQPAAQTDTAKTAPEKNDAPFKVFQTEEEYAKAIQSASSKAKFDWLKENNLSTVEEYKSKTAAAEAAIAEKEALTKKALDLSGELEQLKESNVLLKNGVSDQYKDDLLILAKAKVSDKVDLDSAVKEILDKNPTWKNASPAKIGTPTTEAPKPKDTILDVAAAKYPWLAK